MARRGPKTSDAALAEAVRLIRLGLSKTDAALMAGMSKERFHTVAREGRAALADGQDSAWQAKFVNALEQAEAGFKMAASAVIINAANGVPAQYDEHGNVIRGERSADWKAAAWMLERRFKGEYGARTEISGAEGGPIEIEVTTVETLVAKVHALRPVQDPLALPAGPKGGNGTSSAAHPNGAA